MLSSRRISFFVAILFVAVIATNTVSVAQQLSPPEQPTVKLNLQGDVQLRALIDYMSQRLGIQFLYNDDIAARKVTIRAPREVPVSSLLPLLSSILRMEGLLLINTQTEGWMRIVEGTDMLQHVNVGEAGATLKSRGAGAAVTQVFPIRYAKLDEVSRTLRPFLSPVAGKPGTDGSSSGNLVILHDTSSLIVTDYAANVRTIEELIELIDRPGDVEFELFNVRGLSSEQLVAQVNDVFAHEGDGGKSSPPDVRVFDQSHSNQVLVAGRPEHVARVVALMQRLDTPGRIVSRVYRLRYVSAERVDNIIRGYLPPHDADRLYQSSVDADGNLLVANATAAIHRRIDELIRKIDTKTKSSESPIQFYKLKHANAADVLLSLLALQEATGTGFGGAGFNGAGLGFTPFGSYGAFGGASPFGAAGGGFTPGAGGFGAVTNQPQNVQLPLGDNTGSNNGIPADERAETLRFQSLSNGNLPGGGVNGLQAGVGGNRFGGGGLNALGGFGAGGVATLPGGARVSADISTNSLIVVAPSDVQEMYANLIESLDQRRPQVLVEAKIIAVDTTDSFALGVEVSAGDRVGANRLFNFTSFGLSEVDPVSGALAISPSLGFNGTLVDPDVADVIVQALARHTRAHVLAAPKLLVNDNSTGQLESVTSVPFGSVNASTTVATTSLGGNQTAGTIITVTPQINENKHLLLEFEVEFSTFQGTGIDGLPPPRQIDRVGSTVTIPHGQTVIVGGLKRTSNSRTRSGVPWLENVPIIRELSSRSTEDLSTMSFFLFIRPIILIDNQFSDLKYVSSRSAHKANIRGNYPRSRPRLMR